MSKLKLIETIQTKLPTLSKTDGQLIVVRDNASLYVDLDGNRIYISDWIDVSTETDRLAMLTPLSNKYYYVIETNKIWRYIGGSWFAITKDYIEDTRTIAGINLKNDITADELITALGVDTKAEQTDLDTLASSVAYLSNENDVISDVSTVLTTQSIVDDLNSLSSDLILSANQGRILNDKISNAVSNNEMIIDEINNIKENGRELFDLENVDNTSDIDKPISTATQNELDKKVNQIDFDILSDSVAYLSNENDIVSDASTILTTQAIVDDLNSYSNTMILSANQGRVLNDNYNVLSESVAYLSDDEEKVTNVGTILTTKNIVDNVDSSLSNMVLSAKQGKMLNERISNIISHNNETDGNTELLDIRVSADGNTHYSAGDAIRSQINMINSEIANANTNMFVVLNQSVASGDYTNGNYAFKFPHVINKGTKFRIKLVAKTSGWLQAKTQNGNEITGVEIENSVLNVGDVKIVEGTVTNRTDRLYIYSPNNVECDVTIYIERKTEIIVSQDGRGDYTSLDDALNNAYDGYEFPITIIVRAGTYTMRTETPDDVPYKKGWRFLSIIGEDRNNCIIRNDNGYYSPYTDDSNGLLFDSAPLRLSGNVTIENLTIISTDDNYNQFVENESRVQGVNRSQSYCIHSDFDCYEDSTMLIRNCKLVNDHYCCIGCGTRQNYKIQIENCELETTVNSENTDQGVIFVHSYNLNSGNAYEGQEVFAKNNVIVNKNGVKSCHFYASSPDRLHATLIANVSRTADTQNGFESFGDAFGVTKTELCFGNNIASMNA